MSLSHYQHSQLRRIKASLRRSDPKLASMPAMFGLDRIRQAATLLAKAATVIAAAIHLLLAAARLRPMMRPWLHRRRPGRW
jgi:hypothetical protein